MGQQDGVSPRRTAASEICERSDAELLRAVRAGDTGAYAVLYARHRPAVHRLARRLARQAVEADDIVSEVFANTLQAIHRGGGPADEFSAYVLRAVRNTVIDLRSYTDSAHTEASETARLDQPADDTYLVPGDVEQAFAELPRRFREVLWTTAVEGRTPAELAACDAVGTRDPGAVASLSRRARQALGRSYLRVHTDRPTRRPDCRRVRGLLPGYVQRSAADATAVQVEAHLRHCPDCAAVCAEMCVLNSELRTAEWTTLAAAWLRHLFSTVAAPLTSAATAVPIMAAAATLTVAGVAAIQHAAPGASPDEPLAAPDAAPPATVGVITPRESVTTTTAAAATAPTTAPPATTSTVEAAVVSTIVTAATQATATTLAPIGAAPTEPVPAGASPGSPRAADTTAAPPAVPAPVLDGVGSTVDDVGTVLGDVGAVLGAVPDGLPAVGEATAALLDDVGATVTGAVDTVATVVTTATGVLDAVTDTVGQTLEEVAEVDPDDPVGDTVDDLVGTGGTVDQLLGPGGTVDDLLHGLFG